MALPVPLVRPGQGSLAIGQAAGILLNLTALLMENSGDEGGKKAKKSTGISFGLSQATRRPGVKSGPLGSPLNVAIVGKVEESNTKRAKTALVIPALTDGNILSTSGKNSASPSPAQEAIPYDPDKYGLQVRRKVKGGQAEKIPSPALPQVSSVRAQSSGSLEKLPDPVGLEAYERVPVQEFGAALLRGMGWREGEGIGSGPNKGPAEPLLPKFRFKGLGIGAEQDSESIKSRRTPSPQLELATNKLKRGALVGIVSGEHSGLGGIVETLDAASIRIRLAGSEELVQVTLEQIRLESSSSAPTLHAHNSASHDTGGFLEQPTAGSSWLLPHIRVRFSSKAFQQGALYRKTGDILDISADDDGIIRAVVRLADGRLVNEVHQGLLEPLLPMVDGATVMVLQGPHRGETGTIVGRMPDGGFHIHLRDSMEAISVPSLGIAEAC